MIVAFNSSSASVFLRTPGWDFGVGVCCGCDVGGDEKGDDDDDDGVACS